MHLLLLLVRNGERGPGSGPRPSVRRRVLDPWRVLQFARKGGIEKGGGGLSLHMLLAGHLEHDAVQRGLLQRGAALWTEYRIREQGFQGLAMAREHGSNRRALTAVRDTQAHGNKAALLARRCMGLHVCRGNTPRL